jgi:hypothetical protein
MKKGGSAKNSKQQAAIAMSMKAAGKTPKMKMGGSAKGKTPMTPAQKKFASLAAPKDKITFADKIAGAKKKK